MGLTDLLIIFLIAWLIACIYYGVKIAQIARASHRSIFSISQKSSSSHVILRKLWRNIALATIFFIIAVLIAYFVQSSSPALSTFFLPR